MLAVAAVGMALLAGSVAFAPGARSLLSALTQPSCGRGSLRVVAGSGVGGSFLLSPGGLAIDPAGELYVADHDGHLIRRIDPSGNSVRVAGTGLPGTGGDGGKAVDATLEGPWGLALDAGGDLYVADGDANLIRMIGANGVISTVAGTGIVGSIGDGGPATAAQLTVGSVAVDPAGRVYLDSASAYRAIDRDGIIRAFAGSGTPGWSGDGGPAIAARFLGVSGIATGSNGTVYLGDQNRIRSVDAAGRIATFAGTGAADYTGDGSAATDAKILGPGALAFDVDDGSLYFVDASAVRRIDSAGIIRTVAGGAVAGKGADCQAAVGATLSSPGGLAIHDGTLYIADTGNSRVVSVTQ